MKIFHCDHCGQLLFFENVVCVRCGRALAYVPDAADVVSLDFVGGTIWAAPALASRVRLCENYTQRNVCNWAIPEADPHSLCRSCRFTWTIPNLGRAGNDQRWYKLEVAKRRLLYTLDQLGLALENKTDAPSSGLTFHFLEDPEPGTGERVMTGHDGGDITINVAEADETERVRRRESLNEPFRTLLGHFRHEVGHYYWDRLIRDGSRIAPFRDLFGDERADYQAALDRHYQAGPPAGWQDAFVSAYATMHPWEDWAETWAHYLHMTDALATAAACGMSIAPQRADEPRARTVPDPMGDTKVAFDAMMTTWGTISYVLNNLNRGLGRGDAYPFVLAPRSVEKLRFVHETVATAARR